MQKTVYIGLVGFKPENGFILYSKVPVSVYSNVLVYASDPDEYIKIVRRDALMKKMKIIEVCRVEKFSDMKASLPNQNKIIKLADELSEFDKIRYDNFQPYFLR